MDKSRSVQSYQSEEEKLDQSIEIREREKVNAAVLVTSVAKGSGKWDDNQEVGIVGVGGGGR